MVTSAYKSLVGSASQLAEIDFFDEIDEGNIELATDLLDRVGPILDSARQALNRHCQVPVEYKPSFFPDHMHDLQQLRNLSRAFRMESDVAVRNGDYNLSSRIAVDILELANGARRGGLITDLLVAVAISGVAIQSLRKAREQFDGVTRGRIIAALQRLENQREPFADIAKRDDEWETVTGYEDQSCDFTDDELTDPEECGLSEDEQRQLLQLIQQMADLPEWDIRAMCLDQDRRELALMRMLTVDLALRSWHETSAAFPDDLSLLAPDYLLEIPADPFTDEPFIYRTTGNTFLLYSTGPKQVDGGGEFGAWSSVAAGCADLCVDVNDYGPDC